MRTTRPTSAITVAASQPSKPAASAAFGSEASHLQEVKPALAALEKLESAAPLGISSTTYAELLAEADYQLKILDREHPAAKPIRDKLQTANVFYHFALTSWQQQGGQPNPPPTTDAAMRQDWKQAAENLNDARDLLGIK